MRIRLPCPSRNGLTPYSPIPIPACQQTMSVTVSGPFTIGPTSSPSCASSNQRGSEPRGRSRAYWASMSAIWSSVYGSIVIASFFLRARAFSRSVRTISRYCPESRAPVSSRNTWAVHSWTARPANSLGLSSAATERVAAERAAQREQRRPPLARARRVEGVHAAQRIALHELGVLGRDRRDLVLADERVAADERRRRDRCFPPRSWARTRDHTRAGCRRRRRTRRCGTCRASARV